MTNIEQRTDLRNELNKAIYTVITTKYKKDAKEAHEMVAAFGYEIYKSDGDYCVSSRRTNKKVCVNWRGYKQTTFFLGNNYAKVDNGRPCPIDFVGCLEKPINRAYNELQWKRYRSPAVDKYQHLKDVNWSINRESKKLKELKNQLISIQSEIVYHARQQMREEQRLESLRREYGLA